MKESMLRAKVKILSIGGRAHAAPLSSFHLSALVVGDRI